MTLGCSPGHTYISHMYHCDINKSMAFFAVMEAIDPLGYRSRRTPLHWAHQQHQCPEQGFSRTVFRIMQTK